MQKHEEAALQKAETIPVKEAAKILGIAPMKVKFAILNHTMPVGLVTKEENSTKDRTVIIKTRFMKWINGEPI